MHGIANAKNLTAKKLTAKKALLTIFVIAIFVLLPVLFCACDEDDSNTVKGTARIIVDGESVIDLTVELDSINGSAKLFPVLKSLKEQGKLELNYEESAGGAFITKIGSLVNSGSEYIYVYTSFESDKDVSDWASSLSYDGVKLYSSGVGVSEMTLEDGAMIYFKTITL